MNCSFVENVKLPNKRIITIILCTLCVCFIYLVGFSRTSAVQSGRLATSPKIPYYDTFIPGSDATIKEGPAVTIDLAMQLLTDPKPERNFENYLHLPPVNIQQLAADGRVFSTMFCSRRQDFRDPYFEATQQLIWRMLWSPFASKHPFVVFVCPFVGPEYRAIFKGQGAIVRELPLLDILPDDKIALERWKDQFAKLNLWNQVEFKTIVYLDSDAFPLANINDIFDIIQERSCVSTNLEDVDEDFTMDCKYAFAGVSMPINGVDLVNGGLLVLNPDPKHFQRLLRNARRVTEYDTSTMEQSFLNSKLAFGKDGPFPAQELPYDYNAGANKYPEIEASTLDPSTIRVLHEKLWIHQLGINASPKTVIWKDRWLIDWMHMIRFYNDPLWEEMRKAGRKPKDEQERIAWMTKVGLPPYAYAQDWWAG